MSNYKPGTRQLSSSMYGLSQQSKTLSGSNGSMGSISKTKFGGIMFHKLYVVVTGNKFVG